jgi:hypothetical protein
MIFELIYNQETDKDSAEYSIDYNTFLSPHQGEGYFRTKFFVPQTHLVLYFGLVSNQSPSNIFL